MSLQRIKDSITQVQNRIFHRDIMVLPVLWCLCGALIILTIDIFKSSSKYGVLYEAHQEVIDNIYYIWDKALHVFGFLALFVAYPPLKRYYKYALIYTISTLCYEIITIIFPETAKALDTVFTTILWLMLVIILVTLSLIQLKKENQ